jgi:hypothetical protein
MGTYVGIAHRWNGVTMRRYMHDCYDCGHRVSGDGYVCPNCGRQLHVHPTTIAIWMLVALIAGALLLFGGTKFARADEDETPTRFTTDLPRVACEYVGELYLKFQIDAHNRVPGLNKLPDPSDCTTIKGGTLLVVLDFHKSNGMFDNAISVRTPEGRVLWMQAGAFTASLLH